jgi:hypothetical protein
LNRPLLGDTEIVQDYLARSRDDDRPFGLALYEQPE